MNGVIYASYSSDNQREESIEGQIRECMEYANKQGITIIGTAALQIGIRRPIALQRLDFFSAHAKRVFSGMFTAYTMRS